MIVYGLNAVAEALKAGRVRALWIASSPNPRLEALTAQAATRGVPVRRVPRAELDRAARGGVHQGVVADAEAPAVAPLEALAHGGAEGAPALVVVLDGVEDPHNVGAILRTADAVGASGLVRQTRRAAPLEGATAKAAAGALHHVRVAEVTNVARALERLKALGVWVVGLDAAGKMPYSEVDLTLPTAVVLGAEGRGLRRLVKDRCDIVAAIPMAGHVGSLNVSVAAGVVLFEAMRQRRSRGRP